MQSALTGTCWVEGSDQTIFPIQNLPFGVFETDLTPPGAGVAIGDFVLNLNFLHEQGFFKALELPADIFGQSTLNAFLRLGKSRCSAVRQRIAELLQADNQELQQNAQLRELVLIPAAAVRMLLPVKVPNYTDFYSSEQHAYNVGVMFRDPENALLPNWKHMPVAYHGRASSIVVSGTPIRRPKGQLKKPESAAPVFGPTAKLDFELEVAFITCVDTTLGHPVSVEEARDAIFGFVLFNDWSARDIQQWEYVPLGPFLGKNFGSVMSPWIVTTEALERFRTGGPAQHPEVLPYLKTTPDRHYDISLEVSIQPETADSATIVTRSNMRHLYWNAEQQLAHQTVNGCPIEVGDVYASGTISGKDQASFGSMLELTWNGKNPIKLMDGEERAFIEDGDTVTFYGYAEKNGVKIGFGSCSSKILPAL